MDLNRAHTFVSVVECGGFTAAAARLGLPTSSVSRSIARLEEELGVVLLERTSRKVALTEAGRAYYERAREAVTALAEATEFALETAREPRGLVRVAAPPAFTCKLATILAPFASTHPQVRIAVTFTTRAAELVGDTVDIAIVSGRLPDSALIARRVGQARQVMVASPDYLARRGTPASPAELASHDILDAGPEGPRTWNLQGPQGPHSIVVTPILTGDDYEFVAGAAMMGLGIALLPSLSTRLLREQGKLVEVLPGYGRSEPLQLVTAAVALLPRRVTLLRDHLLEALSVPYCGE